MKVKRVRGRLSDNEELIQRAMVRAKRMADLEPVKRYVDDEHWIFVLPKESAPAPSGGRASKPNRSPEKEGEA